MVALQPRLVADMFTSRGRPPPARPVPLTAVGRNDRTSGHPTSSRVQSSRSSWLLTPSTSANPTATAPSVRWRPLGTARSPAAGTRGSRQTLIDKHARDADQYRPTRRPRSVTSTRASPPTISASTCPRLRCRWSPTSPAQPTRRWLTWRKCWTPKWCTRSPPAHIRVLLVDDGDVPGTVRYDPQRLITPPRSAHTDDLARRADAQTAHGSRSGTETDWRSPTPQHPLSHARGRNPLRVIP
jgi:hypothetical protein